MAQKDLKPNHSSSSEDEEEETSGSEDEQTSGSDSDEVPFKDDLVEKLKQVNESVTARRQSANKPQAPDLSSSETEESGSDTDTDSDSTPKKSVVVDPNVKPISSIPMERVGRNLDSKSVKKDGSKTTSTPPPAKSKRPPTPPPAKSKRPPPAPTAIEKDAKKAKQNTANGEPKKALVASSQPANKPQAPDLSAWETEESGSETDTDSDSTPKKSAVPDPNIKAITSKPIEREGPNLESKSAKKSGSKTVSTPNEKDAKKGKKTTATDDDSKKQLFQRLWSEDDEIVILEGMIDYKNQNGKHPIADMGAFHEYIKKSLHVDVSRAQLVDKVRRLRKKYVNNAGREKDGKDRSFSKSHEQKGYELSKLIWGSNSNNNNNTSGTESKKKFQSQKNGKLKGTVASTSTGTGTGTTVGMLKSNGVDDKDKLMVEVEKKMDISMFVRYGEMSGCPILSEEIVKAGMELVDGSKRAELEAKWKKLKEQELELYVKRMELLKEQAQVVLEAVRSSGN